MSSSHRRICPYLGLARDASTHMGFPSAENLCLHVDPRVSPSFSHQGSFCLRPLHEECSSYREARTSPPQDLPGRRVSRSLLILLAFAVAASLFWLFRMGRMDLQSQASQEPPVDASGPSIPSASVWTFAVAPGPETHVSVPSFTAPATEPSSPVPAPSDTSTSTPHPVRTASPPGRDGLHDFEISKRPADSNQAYLVHLVKYGETLDVIAANFKTTIEAIMTVNYELKPPVWADYPIVVPVGAQDAAGLPCFDVYVVQDYDVIPAESLAYLLGVEVNLLEYYNLCSENCQFDKGDVLLVPRVQ